MRFLPTIGILERLARVNVKLTSGTHLVHDMKVALQPVNKPMIYFRALLTFLTLAVACAAAWASSGQPLQHHGPVVSDEGVDIYWQVDCFDGPCPDSVMVRYNRKSTLASEGEFWHYSEAVPYHLGRITLSDLSPASNYIYQPGFRMPSDRAGLPGYSWEQRKSFESKMPWGTMRFLLMIGALAMFIYGMKTMSEGVQSSAGARLRKALGGMTRNRFAGVASGFGLTALLQSSSATTVMTVSFVNAGLITLTQSAGVMMGANIGTTITGWFVSFIGLRVNITLYALILFAIATPLIFAKNREVRSWSTAFIGFALLFMGLGFLRTTVPTFTEDSAFVQFFIEYSEIPVLGPLLFIMLGVIITVIVQSSSSAITLTMTLCASGVIPLEAAAAMVLGENIGTTATAEIAALVGNVHAKRSARIHTLFNLIGVAWMVFLMPVVLTVIGRFLPENPFGDTDSSLQAATATLAIFHTVFNVANLALLIWFVPQLAKLATFTVRSRSKEDEIARLEFIDSSIQLSELNIVEARKAVTKFAEITVKMMAMVRQLLTETDAGVRHELHQKIRRYEEITDRIEIEISQYCSRISTTELSADSSERVRAMLSISNDLERVGDILNQMSQTIARKSEAKIWFTQEQREKLCGLMDLVDDAAKVMVDNLELEEGEVVDLEAAQRAEREINKARNAIRKEYISRIEKGKYNLRSGSIYSDLFSSLEKVGDHIENVSEALAGKV